MGWLYRMIVRIINGDEISDPGAITNFDRMIGHNGCSLINEYPVANFQSPIPGSPELAAGNTASHGQPSSYQYSSTAMQHW